VNPFPKRQPDNAHRGAPQQEVSADRHRRAGVVRPVWLALVAAALLAGVLLTARVVTLGGSSRPPRPPAPARAVPAAAAHPDPAATAARAGFASGAVGVVHGSARGRLVALTFDDGPGPYTLALVHELERLHVHATFFMVGFEVHWYPRVVREMIRDGDVIGDHTWSHPALATLPPGQVRAQLLRTAAVIQRYGGVRPTLMRPPYGSFDPSVLRLINRLGFVTVLWSVETRDWARPGVTAIIRAALDGVRPGAIILMHDAGGNRSQTLAAVPTIIRALRHRGYRLVTVPELLAGAPPPPSGLNHGKSLAGD